jgi:small-conductance mechanosensitive channel
MAIPPIVPDASDRGRAPILGKTRILMLSALVGLLTLCLAFTWSTRGAMQNLSFLRTKGGAGGRFATKKTLVDLTPWQTAQTLSALAVTAEEQEFAQDAERLADHEVDQAFASALRQAKLRAEHITLKGEALELSQKINGLQQLIVQDQAQVTHLTAELSAPARPAKGGEESANADNNDDLEVAKAQLGLDSDQLADAQRDLDRASGDDSTQIQQQLAAHEASMRQHDKAVKAGGQVAVVSEKRHGTLSSRITAWFNQINRYNLILQAQQKALQDVQSLTSEHNALEAQANSNQSGSNKAAYGGAKLAAIKDRSAERQILSIYDDRILTQQQLAMVYGKWAAQVQIQHGIVLHLILQSLALIIFILICMVLSTALVRRLMAHPALDHRQTRTLRAILEMAIRVVGIVLVLLVIFGLPRETPTILGLATAALTIALQDFILAFLGWFVLVAKDGIRVGDWVEINGVGGEVTEVGLFTTTLLETGTLEDKGHPTGRRITFLNSFAIRGTYFNFSTSGQWMWDEIGVTIPSSKEAPALVEGMHKVVLDETEENARLAESEWKRGTHGDGLSRFSATPVVNLRPSSSGIDTKIRYVTRASERFELRNRLYQRIVELLQRQGKAELAEEVHAGQNA